MLKVTWEYLDSSKRYPACQILAVDMILPSHAVDDTNQPVETLGCMDSSEPVNAASISYKALPGTGAAEAGSSYSDSDPQPGQLSLGLDTPAVAIRIQGKLLPVKLSGHVPHPDDFLFSILNVSSLGPQNLMRYVCITSNPNTVAGWASFECPWFEEAAFDRVVALPIMTARAALTCGLTLGYWLPWADTHHVLFVLELLPGRPNDFKRIGVGMMFGRDFDAALQSSEQRHISLL
jgi:hypothetical protein